MTAQPLEPGVTPQAVPDAQGGLPGTPAALPAGRFEGRVAFQQLVRDALGTAAREGWPEIILSDADFHDWPLGEREVSEALQAWSKGGRRMTLLAISYDDVVRRHARFVRWRGTWDHILTCRRAASADRGDIPSAIWSPQWSMQRLDPERCVGMSGTDPARQVVLKETLLHWIHSKSSPGFSATTLGL